MHMVTFPKLGLEFIIDPVIFSVGDFSLNWYGLLIGVGIMLALWTAIVNSRRFGVIADRLMDAAIGGIIGGIIGARLYYVAFRWDNYKDDLLSIFKTWEGGLAIYGGVIGGLLVGALVCKWRKVKVLPALDLAALGFLIGQSVGRWGNFVNGEAFGTNTDLPWGMTGNRIYSYVMNATNLTGALDAAVPVHPCFLYESLWCAVGFGLLFWYSKHRKFDGEILLMYLAWYGFGRFFIEGLRIDSLMLGKIRVSQLLAGLLVVTSVLIWLIVRSKIKAYNDHEYLKCYGLTEAFAEEYEAYQQSVKEKEEAKKAKKAKKADAAAEEPAEAEAPAEGPAAEAEPAETADEEAPVDVITVSDEEDAPVEEEKADE